MSYHKRIIKKGVFGEISKIREELEELEDANEQGARIMEICELSDIVGAIDGYMKRYHTGYTLDDLKIMAELTASAFKDGKRK